MELELPEFSLLSEREGMTGERALRSTEERASSGSGLGLLVCKRDASLGVQGRADESRENPRDGES